MKTVCFYIHGTINTTGFKSLEGLFHAGAGFFTSDLHTSSGDHALLNFDDAPVCANRFVGLCEAADIPKANRYYLQWSGMLGEDAWDMAGDYLAGEINRVADGEPIKVLIIGFSHGGNVGRVAAEKLLENNPNAQFHMITTGMPLSWCPKILMPTNVITWLQYCSHRDPTQWMGSRLIGSGWPVRTIEGIYKKTDSLHEKPKGWQSVYLTSDAINPHNELVSTASAKAIVEDASSDIAKQFNPQPAGGAPLLDRS